MFERWRRQRARQEFDRVSSQIGYGPLDETLGDLDDIDVRGFSPFEVAEWLNNRAYVLALLGSGEQAVEHANDAEELLRGIEEIDGVTRYKLDLLMSCVIGTRGIAHLHAGSLGDATRDLEDALARGEQYLGSTDRRAAWQQRRLAAERLWWLAQIAEKRGDAGQRSALLARAASFADTPYGEKARDALELTAPFR